MLAVSEWLWVGPVLAVAIGLTLLAVSSWLIWLVASVGFVCDCVIYVWAKLTKREPWDSWLTRFVQEVDG